jgi:hypothetical protein
MFGVCITNKCNFIFHILLIKVLLLLMQSIGFVVGVRI